MIKQKQRKQKKMYLYKWDCTLMHLTISGILLYSLFISVSNENILIKNWKRKKVLIKF